MADLISDGKIRVAWVPTVANIAAPTAVELNAGLLLAGVMTPDGLKTDSTTAEVDNSSLISTFDTRRAGRRGFSNSVKIKRQDSADTALTTLVYRATGFLVVRRGPTDATVAWTVGDKVEVFPSECGDRMPSYGPNSIQAFEVPMFNTSQPNVDAIVA